QRGRQEGEGARQPSGGRSWPLGQGRIRLQQLGLGQTCNGTDRDERECILAGGHPVDARACGRWQRAAAMGSCRYPRRLVRGRPVLLHQETGGPEMIGLLNAAKLAAGAFLGALAVYAYTQAVSLPAARSE